MKKLTKLEKLQRVLDHNATFQAWFAKQPVPLFDHAVYRRSAHPGTKGRLTPQAPYVKPLSFFQADDRTLAAISARHFKLKELKKRMKIHRARFAS